MAAQPIRYFDRYSRSLKTELIYSERWLRFAYENPVGRFATWLLIRRALFSRWYGRRMNKRVSALKVIPFIAQFDVDVDDFAKSPFDYKNFNEFFYRALKPSARPIAPGERVAVFPADGRHLVFPDVSAAAGFYVKGQKFSIADLLRSQVQFISNPADPASAPPHSLAAKFEGAAMVISRLCPSDYHRFHFPVDGTPGEPRLINGALYSVNPIALRRNLRRLVENKRIVTVIESPQFGAVAMVEVGATNVGSIQETFSPDQPAAKGAEKGFFAFGGSCVITLFQRGRLAFDPDLIAQSAQQIETYARMGDRLGEAP